MFSENVFKLRANFNNLSAEALLSFYTERARRRDQLLINLPVNGVNFFFRVSLASARERERATKLQSHNERERHNRKAFSVTFFREIMRLREGKEIRENIYIHYKGTRGANNCGIELIARQVARS